MGLNDEIVEFQQEEEPESNRTDVAMAMKTALDFFLQQQHYRQLHRILAEQWKGCHSLSAATALMKAHGVDISPEEEDKLAEMDEERMIQALVMRMPTKKPEQFEHFFLQLSFIASTTTRLRTSLEAGNHELIEEALDSAENVGVLPYLLKMAVSQAGQEVQTLEQEHDSWLTATDARMNPLLTTAGAAVDVQKELTQAKSTIRHFQNESKEKSRSVLMGMVRGNEQSLMAAAFHGFADYIRRVRKENEIKRGYQDELDSVNKQLYDFREAQLKNIKGVLKKQSKAATDNLLMSVIAALKAEEKLVKEAQATEAQEKELVQQIQGFTQKASSNAKAAMSRMAEGTSSGLMAVAFKSFVLYAEESKKEREREKEVQQKEQQTAEFMKKQKGAAKSFMTTMVAQSNGALLQAALTGWIEASKEEKEELERSSTVNAKHAMISDFTKKNKASTTHAAENVAYLEDMQIVTFALCIWKREAKIDRMRRLGKEKNDRRKKELVGVKGLFKNFANELETNLEKGTPRVDVKPARRVTGPNAA